MKVTISSARRHVQSPPRAMALAFRPGQLLLEVPIATSTIPVLAMFRRDRTCIAFRCVTYLLGYRFESETVELSQVPREDELRRHAGRFVRAVAPRLVEVLEAEGVPC